MMKTARQFQPRNMRSQLIPWILLISFLGTTSSFAQNDASSAGAKECLSLENAAMRLACYDKLFAPATGQNGSAPSVVDEPAPSETLKAPEPNVEDFGNRANDDTLTRPVVKRSKSAAKITKTPKIESISQRVVKIDTVGYKKLRVTLENGQVWEQIGSVTQRPPKLSKKRPLIAEIRRAALSSFSMQFDGKGRAFKVRRIR